MQYRIEAAEARPNYRVWIRFAHGVEGEVDLSELVGQEVFRSWEFRANSRRSTSTKRAARLRGQAASIWRLTHSIAI